MFSKTSLKAIVKEVENLNKWRETVKELIENGKSHRLGPDFGPVGRAGSSAKY